VLELGPPSGNPASITLTSTATFLNGAAYGPIFQPQPAGQPRSWILNASNEAIAVTSLQDPATGHLNPDAIEDILLLCDYRRISNPDRGHRRREDVDAVKVDAQGRETRRERGNCAEYSSQYCE
jgi:hypothetical protein